MRHRRKGPPIRTLAYKYFARPIGELPPALWSVQHMQNRLWNRLVQHFRAVSTEVKAMAAMADDQAAIKARWRRALEEYRQLRDSSGLYWSFSRQTLDNFDAAIRQRATVQNHHLGLFDDQRPITSVMLAHQYYPPSQSVRQLFSPASKRVRFDPDTFTRGLTSGDFWLGHDQQMIRFDCVLHRPLPSQAVLKRISWCGQHLRDGWHWWLVVCFDLPAPPATANMAIATITLHDTHAYLTSNDGVALNIPLGVSASGRLRRHSRSRKHGERNLPVDQATIDAELALHMPGKYETALLRSRRRMIRHRQWLYRNLAKAIAVRYGSVRLVRPATFTCQPIAAPHELESYIHHAMAAGGGQVIAVSQMDGDHGGCEQIDQLRNRMVARSCNVRDFIEQSHRLQ